MNRRVISLLGILLVLGLLIWFAWSRNKTPMDTEALKALGYVQITVESVRPIEFLDLVDANGAKFEGQQLRDKWTFAFFGFTHCPDICPLALSVLQKTEHQLLETSPPPVFEKFQVLFVSVDPGRDGPTEVRDFVEHFSPRFLAVTGTEDGIDNLVQQVGIAYRRIPSASKLEYLVEHQGYLVVINPDGHFFGYIKPREERFDHNQLMQLYQELEQHGDQLLLPSQS